MDQSQFGMPEAGFDIRALDPHGRPAARQPQSLDVSRRPSEIFSPEQIRKYRGAILTGFPSDHSRLLVLKLWTKCHYVHLRRLKGDKFVGFADEVVEFYVDIREQCQRKGFAQFSGSDEFFKNYFNATILGIVGDIYRHRLTAAPHSPAQDPRAQYVFALVSFPFDGSILNKLAVLEAHDSLACAALTFRSFLCAIPKQNRDALTVLLGSQPRDEFAMSLFKFLVALRQNIDQQHLDDFLNDLCDGLRQKLRQSLGLDDFDLDWIMHVCSICLCLLVEVCEMHVEPQQIATRLIKLNCGTFAEMSLRPTDAHVVDVHAERRVDAVAKIAGTFVSHLLNNNISNSALAFITTFLDFLDRRPMLWNLVFGRLEFKSGVSHLISLASTRPICRCRLPEDLLLADLIELQPGEVPSTRGQVCQARQARLISTTRRLGASLSCETRTLLGRAGSTRQTVAIDGSNVAMSHGSATTGQRKFSSWGLAIAARHFVKLDFKVVIFLPSSLLDLEELNKLENAAKILKNVPPAKRPDDFDILDALRRLGLVAEVPAKDYDDSYFLEYCRRHKCLLVSNDKFRDYVIKCPSKQETAKRFLADTVISFMFVEDEFLPNPDFKYAKHTM